MPEKGVKCAFYNINPNLYAHDFPLLFLLGPQKQDKEQVTSHCLQGVSDYTRGWEKSATFVLPMKITQHLITESRQTLRSEDNNKRKYSYYEAYEEIKGIREVR